MEITTAMGMRDRPDVSVVVIAYNDAGRLPRAVSSVLGQSLPGHEVLIVDDASTDGTGRVAERLAARYPGRVAAVHLPENSGGCGRPRNTGVELARGRHVMFLDSDDVLDRHACLNLVTAAEETGADLVSGLCVRSYPGRPPRESPWYSWLYRNRAVHPSVGAHPNLLYDTLSTNKCYRREFLLANGLRFTERLHYEDLLFTAEAYLAASAIALLPHRVYTWFVEPDGGRQSISNRRRELRNLADRLEIHRRIDRVLREGPEELRLAKDAKFVNHDLPLVLRDLPAADDAFRTGFLALVGPYVADLHPEVLEKANPLPAIAAYLVGRGDLDGAIAAADFTRHKNPPLPPEVVERDGRIFWSARHLDLPGRDVLDITPRATSTDPAPKGGSQARDVLDITPLGLHTRPLSRLRPRATATDLALGGGSRVLIAGQVTDPLGRIPVDAEVGGAALQLQDRRHRGRVLRVPAKASQRGDRIEWRAEFDSLARLRPLGLIDPVWDARLELRVNGDRFVTRVAADADGPLAMPVRPKLTRFAGSRLKAYVTEQGNLSFVLDGESWAARVVARRLCRFGLAQRLWRGARLTRRRATRVRASTLRRLTARKTKIAMANRVFSRLPVRRGTVVFESHLGKQYSDNPKYIYRELRRSGAVGKAFWSYEGSPKGFPSDATLVKRESWAYYYALARAEFWVDNQGFPAGLRKRKATTYIQTWHGSAYKRMGFDQPALKKASRWEQNRFRDMVKRYDCFLTRSGHDERTLARGMGVTAELMPVGYPRNDPLVNGPDPELAAELSELREELGLDGRPAVLYAPTFQGKAGLAFDPERVAAELGEELIFLVRPHYLSRSPARRSGGSLRDVGQLPDITPLLLLADALITDRSSVMFDYALLDRPMIFYWPDDTDPDGYFDLEAEAPGPIVRDEDGLLAALFGLEAVRREYAGRRRTFAARYGEHDRGTAAKAVAARIVNRETRRG